MFLKKKNTDNRIDSFEFMFDFEEVEKFMDSLMDNAVKERLSEKPRENSKPLVFGMTITFDGNGQPKTELFGNVNPNNAKQVINQAREPLFQIAEGKKESIITMELPGIREKDMNLSFNDGKMTIEAKNESNWFRKELLLPKKVDLKQFKTSLNNGILEIIIPH